MISKSDLKKPLESLSKLRQEEVLRYKQEEEREEISAIGQDSERKGAKWAQESVNREDKKDEETRLIQLSLLESLRKRGKKVEYLRFLAKCLIEEAKKEKIPKKYRILIDLTDKGVVLQIGGTNFVGAFAPCGISHYDLRYCKVMAIKLGNTIAKLEGYIRKSDGGIVLPDEIDLQTIKSHGRSS